LQDGDAGQHQRPTDELDGAQRLTEHRGGAGLTSVEIVLPAGHAPAARPGPVPITRLRGEVWAASAEGTGHHAMVVGACRALGGYEPDLRHRSNDADVQLELVPATPHRLPR
jgi:hypothetical protein